MNTQNNYLYLHKYNKLLTIKFNFIDVNWKLSDQDGSPDFPQKSENIFDTETWDHSNDILPTERPQNNYSIDND